MPRTTVVFFQHARGDVPALDWLGELRRTDRRGYAKCVARIHRLVDAGWELRRPETDFVRDGIHELRVRRGRLNYRILYFFHGRDVAVLVHGLSKESKVPEDDVERALRRRAAFEKDPEGHTFEMESGEDE